MTNLNDTPVGRSPETDSARLAAINAAASVFDMPRAIALAKSAFDDGLEAPVILHLVAQNAEDERRFEDSLALLRRARALAPRDVFVLNGLAVCLTRMHRIDEAIAVLNEALAIQPTMASALCNKARAQMAVGNFPEARALFEQAALFHPNEYEPLSALAVLALARGEAEEAKAFAHRALTINAADPGAAIALAQADVLERNYDAAASRINRLLARTPNLKPESLAVAQGALGDALDGLDRPAEAFAAYTEGKAITKRLTDEAAGPEAAESSIDLARRLKRHFLTTRPQDWGATAGPDDVGARAVRGHVFLVGFPRSGTTLLEQVMASHPDVISLEEKGILAHAANHWIADDVAFGKLVRIDADAAAESRRTYWRLVQGSFPSDISNKIFVDKLPLDMLKLPIVAKLFPNSKILFARRDPRDVVLSCFRRRFTINSAMYQFLTLDGAAKYYDAVTELSELYLKSLPLNVHILKNEELIADFEGVSTAALKFIGVDWSPSVLGFAARARGNAHTPSAPQISRGLSADGVGQWRRYQDQIAPILPILDPWAERFGYARSGPSGIAPAPPARDPTAGDDAAPNTIDVEQRRAAQAQQAIEACQQALQAGAWLRAIDLAEAGLKAGVRLPLLYKLRAMRREQEGSLDLAITDFEASLALEPNDFGALNALGLCLAKAGQMAEALQRLDASLALDPNFAPAHYNRGWTLEGMGELAGAAAAHRRAVELDPNHARALGDLASIAARVSDWTEARAMANRALTLVPRLPSGHMVLAQADHAAGDTGAAERRLQGLLNDRAGVSLYERSIAFGILGDVLDEQDRTAEAFRAYRAANDGLRSFYAPRFGRSEAETGLAQVERLARYFERASAEPWRAPISPDLAAPSVAAHVFLVGFPRSGTTLTGQILAAHPDVVTLDERETLAEAAKVWMESSNTLDELAVADASKLDAHRARYWQTIAGFGLDVAGKVFVDKLPMNTLGLPIISKLFPAAKIIFMRRDPRDVILSCFRRRLAINQSTWELLTVPGAARFYDAVMRLADTYMERLPLDLQVQSFEALATDFDSQTRGLLQFVGLSWRAEVEIFAQRMDRWAVATPSGTQIARGLNVDGIGRWRLYRNELLPGEAILAPWIEKFGYPPD